MEEAPETLTVAVGSSIVEFAPCVFCAFQRGAFLRLDSNGLFSGCAVAPGAISSQACLLLAENQLLKPGSSTRFAIWSLIQCGSHHSLGSICTPSSCMAKWM